MITLDDKHDARLQRLSRLRVLPALAQELVDNAGVIAADASFSIIDGATSGSGHVPSAPGQPPNADTHDLDQSIHVAELVETPDGIKTGVIADSDHALYMEKGTVNVTERPFLTPAMERQRNAVPRGLRDTFNRALR